MEKVTSVLLVGIGGQGVLKASDILARAAFLAGSDVKKSEIHGMSQRGGGVTSTVRFGDKVHSPLAPFGTASVMIALDRTEGEKYLDRLAPDAKVFFQDDELVGALADARCANVALLGVAASTLGIPAEMWEKAIAREMKKRHVAMNVEAFGVGRGYRERKGADG